MKIGRYAVVAIQRIDGEESQDVIGTADTFESLCSLILQTYRAHRETLVSIDVFRRMSAPVGNRSMSEPSGDHPAADITANYQV